MATLSDETTDIGDELAGLASHLHDLRGEVVHLSLYVTDPWSSRFGEELTTLVYEVGELADQAHGLAFAIDDEDEDEGGAA